MGHHQWVSTAAELEPRADRPGAHQDSAHQDSALNHRAPGPARGGYADGFEPLARRFAEQLEHGREIGAGLTVFHRGRCVVDVYGGLADRRSKRPWRHDSRVVLFSVSKGFAAMAMLLLNDRGRFDWDDPVAKYWPGFAAKGKGDISIRTLMNHRGGLLYLD
ncbi:MAG TPA: class A beta-lactamase-related serine hydrolase, partial [Polyangiaceae bacterium]|nr:class A beta-lactamase-related serine hydrolase [Polyangiaceae bacterium]